MYGLEIQQQIEKGIAILRQGGIVAFPTDTVYGLGACANLHRAVERVYTVKERPRSLPLPLLLADVSQVIMVADSVPPIAWHLIHSFLPGALTIVLPKSNSVSDILTAGGTTIAIRIPDHAVPIALVQGLETPIVGTSANLNGQPSSLTAGEVCSQLEGKIDFIIDGGQGLEGKESTIVDVTGPIPVIRREGAISNEKIGQVCDNIILREG